MDKRILSNKIQTPDGTILESFNTHDYKEYLDKNGELYIVDGGRDYLRRSNNIIPYEECSLYTDSPFKLLRQELRWGTYGKSGKETLKYVLLCNMSNSHICSIIENLNFIDPDYLECFLKELEYRELNNITIED